MTPGLLAPGYNYISFLGISQTDPSPVIALIVLLPFFAIVIIVVVLAIRHSKIPMQERSPAARRAAARTKLTAGIRALKSGHKLEARGLLQEAVELDPSEYKAWIWLSRAAEDGQTKKTCLRKAHQLNPNNSLAPRERNPSRGLHPQSKHLKHTAGGKTVSYYGTGDCEIGREVVRRYKARQRDFRHTDLRGVGLKNVDLHGADLSHADLRKADLRGANLSNVDLRGANLSGADLRGAYLLEADLRGANLHKAALCPPGLFDLVSNQETNLTKAKLSGANLREANLQGARVTQEQLAVAADLGGATMPDGTLELKTRRTFPASLIRTDAQQPIPPNVRQAVLDRDDYICRYCGRRAQTMEVDHIMPVSKGGASELHNLVTACRKCNRRKADRTPDEAQMEVLPVRTTNKR